MPWFFMKSFLQPHLKVSFMARLGLHRPTWGWRAMLGWGLVSLVSSCAWVDQPLGYVARSINPYRFELIQGNVITKEQFDVLRPGMKKEQVKEVLGTPLITSLFHEERWDYAFTVRRSGQEIQKKKLTVYFVKGELVRFESDPLPSEVEFAATIDIKRPSLSKLPALQASPEQLAEMKKKPISKEAEASTLAQERAVIRSNYPPLEPN
jgi:outer membrane protein assembly factor BamE